MNTDFNPSEFEDTFSNEVALENSLFALLGAETLDELSKSKKYLDFGIYKNTTVSAKYIEFYGTPTLEITYTTRQIDNDGIEDDYIATSKDSIYGAKNSTLEENIPKFLSRVLPFIVETKTISQEEYTLLRNSILKEIDKNLAPSIIYGIAKLINESHCKADIKVSRWASGNNYQTEGVNLRSTKSYCKPGSRTLTFSPTEDLPEKIKVSQKAQVDKSLLPGEVPQNVSGGKYD